MIYIYDIVEWTTADGPGYRTAIYSSGCPNKCKGCQVPQTWDIEAGEKMRVEDILKICLSNEDADVSFLGGEPFFQAGGFSKLARQIKQLSDKSIWCWSGYTLEKLLSMNDSNVRALLENIDVLVDGPFIESKKEEGLIFRGSSNQRIINVRESLKLGIVVEDDYEKRIKI